MPRPSTASVGFDVVCRGRHGNRRSPRQPSSSFAKVRKETFLLGVIRRSDVSMAVQSSLRFLPMGVAIVIAVRSD